MLLEMTGSPGVVLESRPHSLGPTFARAHFMLPRETGMVRGEALHEALVPDPW